jgi:hypothetical protein
MTPEHLSSTNNSTISCHSFSLYCGHCKIPVTYPKLPAVFQFIHVVNIHDEIVLTTEQQECFQRDRRESRLSARPPIFHDRNSWSPRLTTGRLSVAVRCGQLTAVAKCAGSVTPAGNRIAITFTVVQLVAYRYNDSSTAVSNIIELYMISSVSPMKQN